ncbi:MAG TPA: tRNA lysidine(34) synthetase TilS [Caproiciproducens sp.]|nr:tRNA lysidine(34) synthetase TilS [Caproiciproducens sp.]
MNNRIQKIEDQIRGVIAKWNMLPENGSVVVGLSGGADSMALTHFLLNYGKTCHIRITAAHINHGIRGLEADRDEHFVSDWCKRNDIELKILNADVPKLAGERSQGLEECGRNIRYDFFRSVCPENGKIATAHTLSDSAETVLMNLAKGTGTRGLSGIPPVRGNIIRPLIGITRSQVEEYCAFYGLSFVTDSTNLTGDYGRNRVRHTVIPVLKEINPEFESSLYRMTQNLSADEDYFLSLARATLAGASCRGGYSLAVLNGMPDPVLARAVFLAVGAVTRSRLSENHIHAVIRLIRSGSGSVTVAGGIQCSAQGNTLFVVKQGEDELWEVPFQPNGTLLPDGRRLVITKLTNNDLENRRKFNNLLFNNLINYDTIINISSVRNRRNGDSFRPAGRGVTKSLKKLFNEAKLEPILRSRVVILQGKDQIAWIEGFGASREFCVTEQTKNIAEIKIC